MAEKLTIKCGDYTREQLIEMADRLKEKPLPKAEVTSGTVIATLSLARDGFEVLTETGPGCSRPGIYNAVDCRKMQVFFGELAEILEGG